MNLDDLKLLLGEPEIDWDTDWETNSNCEAAELDEVRQYVMNSRRRFDMRDLREIVVCVFVFIVFSPFVSSGMPWMTRLGALVFCIAAVFITLSLSLGRHRHRVWPELSVLEFLDAEIEHLNYQIRLLRNVSWWYLAPIAVGYLLFVWGLMPTHEALAASAGYFVLDRVINGLNQSAVKTDLLPQKEELVRVYHSLNDTVERNANWEPVEE